MEKIECKACSASVDKSIEFCSSCGEWLGLSIKDVETSGAKTEPEVTRRVRPSKELLSQPLSNYGATSLPTRNEVPGIRAVFFLAIIIPLIAAASYYYNQNIAEEVIEEIQVVEQSQQQVPQLQCKAYFSFNIHLAVHLQVALEKDGLAKKYMMMSRLRGKITA
ncbi:MAG: hypothetical protein EVA27_00160 [Candidatus Actinomarinales bacterium]|nr:MAG: hypothetical protein EVA27_00160 [Candidatus Actinomarinales bacterium]